MPTAHRSTPTAVLLLLLASLPGVRRPASAGEASLGPAVPLLELTAPANVLKYSLRDCKAVVMPGPWGKALKLSFGHSYNWPHIKLVPADLGFRSDWSGFAFLALTVSNLSDTPVKASVRVDSEAVKGRGRQGSAEAAPGRATRILMPIDDRHKIIGMRGQPPARYARTDGDAVISHNGTQLDAARITEFQLFMGRPARDYVFLLHRVELVRADDATSQAFVDRFGQYTDADWPGKLQSEAELAQRRRAEEEDLRTHPPPEDRNQYGGWRTGPLLEATGRFRTRKHDGTWWLVDPEGKLFWSSGITCVRFNAATVVAGRESCFTWLPKEDDPLAAFYQGRGRGRMYDFFRANARRKYGEDCDARFHDTTVRRLRSWGVNTIANWSSPGSWRLRRVPYTIPVHPPKVPSFVATSHVMAGLEKKKWFPDPFAPEFRDVLGRKLAGLAEFRDDPWLLGVFIHNELPWALGNPWRSGRGTGIGAISLRSNGTFAVKRALVKHLETTYPSISDLNRAWGTDIPDWDACLAPLELTDEQKQKAKKDLAVLDQLIARQYFRVCREAMDAHMPGVLYLGCRFSGMYSADIVRVAAEYCDVVSFNIYDELPTGRTADELATDMDFPVVIGEFHFGALDRGMFHTGLRRAQDQTERARKYAAYLRAAATAPWCVGAHWFQYLDQALTGRRDGENYNIGFVDATDDPYPEMRAAAREFHRELYTIRAGQ